MTAKPGLEWLLEDASKYGFAWGDLSVIRAVSHRKNEASQPTRIVQVVDARTGNGVDVYVSPTGRKITSVPFKMKPRKEKP